ncbi:hypothetical protein WOLCODRAFT_155571 [Wolfiporia cocos MD-104 SS10]|uniref:Uncharacterized protein n=1 Tax=Wolfiporia cocos (strain MD-104) TaxID=742152 RepID=A0A2H3JFY8_WOLCO|nr:hypothetical protein WOLCODRAFT_155571 [Wolfiporia cocos MD-104 SS10]
MLSPGMGSSSGKRKKKGRADDAGTMFSTSSHLSKQDICKMPSKSLKLSFPCEVEVEIVTSTVQPALMVQPTLMVHTFTFTLPVAIAPLASSPLTDVLRPIHMYPSSVLLSPSPGFM